MRSGSASKIELSGRSRIAGSLVWRIGAADCLPKVIPVLQGAFE